MLRQTYVFECTHTDLFTHSHFYTHPSIHADSLFAYTPTFIQELKHIQTHIHKYTQIRLGSRVLHFGHTETAENVAARCACEELL